MIRNRNFHQTGDGTRKFQRQSKGYVFNTQRYTLAKDELCDSTLEKCPQLSAQVTGFAVDKSTIIFKK